MLFILLGRRAILLEHIKPSLCTLLLPTVVARIIKPLKLPADNFDLFRPSIPDDIDTPSSSTPAISGISSCADSAEFDVASISNGLGLTSFSRPPPALDNALIRLLP
ncbi:hypothetical protein M422DRAFT_238647 [Sphaerobolus stellatus SS14]|nr:hypothetical protein M422DRAFT_238647 [Sphaerobolus stellatus SS14]